MITPIIMEADMEVAREKMGILAQRGVEQVHFDIGDGLFSDLLTITPADLAEFDWNNWKLDLHLLVDDPMEWVEECVALKPSRIIGQIERMGKQQVFMEVVEGYGVEAGLALKLETSIEAIEEELLDKVGTILLLEVPPGTTGSRFDMRVIKKIKNLRKIFPRRILVDGGINPETYKIAMQAGADEAGANSACWRGDFDEKN